MAAGQIRRTQARTNGQHLSGLCDSPHRTLSIKGEIKQVELPITLLGSRPIPGEMQAMLGGAKEVASFKAATAVNRGDFGVGVGNWASNMVVGSDVGIEILLEAHRK